MAPFYMSLNKAALLFFPLGTLDASTGKSAQSHVVQAIIRTPEYARTDSTIFMLIQLCRPTTVGLLAAFFLAQADITVRGCRPCPRQIQNNCIAR